MVLLGCDLSNHQGTVDFDRAVGEGGIQFCIVKATEGVGFTDKFLARNWPELKRLGIPRGAYHFARPSQSSAEDEAAFFIGTMQTVGLEPGDLVALDMEDDKFPVGQNVSPWTLKWLRAVETALGFKPLMYTYPSYIGERNLTDPALAVYPLWFADYDDPVNPTAPWPTWAIRQFTANGTVPGLGASIDLDRFDGTRDELLALGKPGAALAPATGVTTPAISWEGEGEIVASEEWVIVKNAEGKVYQRRRVDGSFGPWVELTKAG